MKDTSRIPAGFVWLFVVSCWMPGFAFAFEGRISASLSRGGETGHLLYTVGTNFLRIEQTDTNWPHPRNVLNLQSGQLTLIFPHNRSFLRLASATAPPAATSGFTPQPPGASDSAPPPPEIPPAPGPQADSPGVPPNVAGAMPSFPTMPGMPVPPMEKMELVKTNGQTNIVGQVCARYELKQHGQTMEIWATDRLFPFQPYLQNQAHRAGPRMLEDQWAEILQAKKLFPLLAVLKLENGAERLRFEVTAITPEKIEDNDDALFQPPPDYLETQPLPF